MLSRRDPFERRAAKLVQYPKPKTRKKRTGRPGR
jgi:hypothetical protein